MFEKKKYFINNKQMNIFTTVVFMSLFWILFSQLNELRSANTGCCGDSSCGTSEWDKEIGRAHV